MISKNDTFETMGHARLLAMLAFVGYFFLMIGNGIISLTHPDEVFYVQTAKEMIRHKSWLVPIIFDSPQFEKPILFYWLLAGAIKQFGETAFVARFWPSFFAIIGIGVTYLIAWILFGKKRTAFLSGLILASSFIYLALARAVLTDMVFSVWVVMAITLFCWAYHCPQRANRAIVLWGAVMGCAVLTKGLLGIVLPGVVILSFLIFKNDLVFLKRWSVILGAAVFFAIAVPWHVLMYQWHGQGFVQEYFYNIHLRRILEAEHARLDNGYFYLWLMFAGVLPWSFFWPATGHWLWRQLRTKALQHDRLVFLLAWIVGIYAIVQLAHSKLASYIFPVFPAIAILLARFLDHELTMVAPAGRSKVLTVCGHVFMGFLGLLILGAWIAVYRYRDFVPQIQGVYVLTFLLILVATLVFVFNRRRAYVAMLCAHTGLTAVLLITLFWSVPLAERWVSCKDISDLFKTIDHSDTVVLASKFYVRGIRYYTDRAMAVIDINGKGFFSPHAIPFLNTDQKVLDFLATQSVTYAIVKEGNVEDLRRITTGHPYHLEELQGIGGKYILRISRI